MTETYRFGNGVVLRRRELMDIQVQRYAEPGNPNLHVPIEEEWLLKRLEACGRTDPVFLDVGAAVGYYSILVKKKWPGATVIAIEPLPEHIDALHVNAALNGLQIDDIKLVPVAVAARDTSVFLKLSVPIRNPPNGSTLYPSI
jgi:methylase of polypeptide subunit release factors